MSSPLNPNGFLKPLTDCKALLFYKKTVILYDMTYYFVNRYLERGDRTIDQMVQAARSGKQNIVEGLEDGMTSMEMALKLLNVARGSLKELQEDYEDQLRVNGLPIWTSTHPRSKALKDYCFANNDVGQYAPYFERWNLEEFCNTALTLIHQADRGIMSYLTKLEAAFLAEGGIKEQMSAARRRVRGY
ncbi:MAG: four helix bundle suffix domain-containing protein [Paludibacteraceae bacterium]|nr:four helix bundle suffix domain-containing protein [Paludibacteraceae bacterium]